MTKTQVEVITSGERRRRWPRAEKERIVAASMELGAVASAVAREAGIHASQLYRWRQELCGRARAAKTVQLVHGRAVRAQRRHGGAQVIPRHRLGLLEERRHVGKARAQDRAARGVASCLGRVS